MADGGLLEADEYEYNLDELLGGDTMERVSEDEEEDDEEEYEDDTTEEEREEEDDEDSSGDEWEEAAGHHEYEAEWDARPVRVLGDRRCF